MKKIIIIVAILLAIAILIGVCIYFKTPAELRALKKEIKKEGAYSEQSDHKLLAVGEGSKLYEGENGTVVLYRLNENEADGYVCLVRVFFTGESVKNGVYEWDADVSHMREGDFKMKGSFRASELSLENKEIGLNFTYNEDKASDLMKFYLESYVFETLYSAVSDLSTYLNEGGVDYTAKDYGFESFGK